MDCHSLPLPYRQVIFSSQADLFPPSDEAERTTRIGPSINHVKILTQFAMQLPNDYRAMIPLAFDDGGAG
jgi:hypothetical protein